MMSDTPLTQYQLKGDIWSVDVLNPYTQTVFIYLSHSCTAYY